MMTIYLTNKIYKYIQRNVNKNRTFKLIINNKYYI